MKQKTVISYRTGLIIISTVLIAAVVGTVIVVRDQAKKYADEQRIQQSAANIVTARYPAIQAFNDAPAAARPLVKSLADASFVACGKTQDLSKVPTNDLSKHELATVVAVTPSSGNPDASPAIKLRFMCAVGTTTDQYLALTGKHWKKVGQTVTDTLDCTTVDTYKLSKQFFANSQCVNDEGSTSDVQWP